MSYAVCLAAVVFIFGMALYWSRLLAGGKKLPVEETGQTDAGEKKSFSFSGSIRPMTRGDRIAVFAVTAVYAAVAFTGLGDRRAPESFCRFPEGGGEAVIELREETDISSIAYYTGLNTGKYTLSFSEDGENYKTVSVIEQDYSSLFKWRTAEWEENVPSAAKYIRIEADGDLWLGEIALMDASGSCISAGDMKFTGGAELLFDEQQLVPELFSYLNSTYFDEIYHGRTALEFIEGIYPYEISHPPLGKLILAVGIELFGMVPFGWRFMGTLCGVLMLPVIYVFLNALFGKPEVSACGTVIFAFDFMHFVQTRIATIDTYAVLFILLMYLFMWRFMVMSRKRDLALSGLFFGLGAASKWTCIYAGAGLGVLWIIYWITHRKDERFLDKLCGNILFCLLFFVALPCAVYYLSYIPYGTAKGMSFPGMLFSGDYADIVLRNQKYMFDYHSGLVSEHPYASRWYQWMVDERPILYYLNYFEDGTKSTFGAFLSPLLCWGGLVAMLLSGFLVFIKRDSRALFILVGYLAQLLPWLFISRLTFEYHYFPSAVFLTLALCYIFSETADAGVVRWKRPMYVFTAASVLLFAVFYPVLTGARVSQTYCDSLIRWLPSWPF